MKRTIRIVGCGGAGINSLKRIVDAYQHESMDVLVLDTSKSNHVSEAITERKLELGDGLGSGKDRSKNADAIIAEVPKLIDNSADVTVIITSTAGGSGNLIANLVASKMLKANQRIVMVLIAHTNTLTNAENTRKAFKSLQSMCNDKWQIPCFIYDNKDGRSKVDKNLVDDMKLFLELFTNDYAELDDTDKLRFLQPKVIGPNSIGLYPDVGKKGKDEMSFSENQLVLPKNGIIPSVITINKTGDSEEDFTSMEDAVGIDSKFKCIGFSGVPISPTYLTYLGERLDDLRRMTVKHSQIDLLDEAAESVSDDIEI